MLKSLSRGLQVLHCFTPDNPSLQLTEIAAALGIPKGSAFRVIATLEELGYIQQDPTSKRYRLGVQVLALGQTCLAGLIYPDIALPHLEELAHKTRESASMAILDGNEIVYVARASIQRVMSSNLYVGSRLPSYCTSMGKVLLAHLGDETRQKLLANTELKAYTHKTITDPNQLRGTLEQIRLQGYAISDEELELNLKSAAAPIRNGSGAVVAAINVSMLASRVQQAELENTIIPRLLESAQAISNALGFRPGVRNSARRQPFVGSGT